MIIALQKASAVPMELTKQNLFQCIEDMGNIWLDLMRVHYGTRYVETRPTEAELQAMDAAGMGATSGTIPAQFDFGILDSVPLSIKLDIGGSAYWSEIAQMNTLDNLLMQNKISIVDYLERVPSGYISNQQELIRVLREREQQAVSGMQGDSDRSELQAPGGDIVDFNQPVDIPTGQGYGQLQRLLNTTGAEGLNLTGR